MCIYVRLTTRLGPTTRAKTLTSYHKKADILDVTSKRTKPTSLRIRYSSFTNEGPNVISCLFNNVSFNNWTRLVRACTTTAEFISFELVNSKLSTVWVKRTYLCL